MWVPHPLLLLGLLLLRLVEWRPVCSSWTMDHGLWTMDHGPSASCIIQQNSEWLFFMGLFISFDHLFQVAFVATLRSPALLFHYFYTVSSCLRSKWFWPTVTQKSSNGPGPHGHISIEPKTLYHIPYHPHSIPPLHRESPEYESSYPFGQPHMDWRRPLFFFFFVQESSQGLSVCFQRIISFYFMLSPEEVTTKKRGKINFICFSPPVAIE